MTGGRPPRRHRRGRPRLNTYLAGAIPFAIGLTLLGWLLARPGSSGVHVPASSSKVPPAPKVDYYVSQTGDGSRNGSSCSNAEPVSWFNNAAHWGPRAEIVPGKTIGLCGTIDSPLGVSGSGRTGNPITIYFEPGARLSEPVCPPEGCFWMKGASYITLDGGSDGVIESTANGTELANQKAGTRGVQADDCVGCVIKNLTIRNMYAMVGEIHFSGTASGRNTISGVSSFAGLLPGDGISGADIPSGDYISSIDRGGGTITLNSPTTGSASGESLTAYDLHGQVSQGESAISISGSDNIVANNTMHDDDWALGAGWGCADANDRITGNDFYNNDHGIAFYPNNVTACSGGDGNVGPIVINDNHFHDFSNWDTGSFDYYHHDGIHCFTSSGGTAEHYNGLYIYNNRFDGRVGGNTTSQIFMEGSPDGTPCADATSRVYIFNNVITSTDQAPANAYFGAAAINGGEYNNTVIGAAGGVCGGYSYEPTGASIGFQNNLFSGCDTLVTNSGTQTGDNNGVFKSGSPDYNVYANAAGDGSAAFQCENTYYSFSDFSGWQSCLKNKTGGTAPAWDRHSIVPASADLNSNGSLQAGSPAIRAGANLTSLCSGHLVALCATYKGPPLNGGAGTTTPSRARPVSGAWDAGAY